MVDETEAKAKKVLSSFLATARPGQKKELGVARSNTAQVNGLTVRAFCEQCADERSFRPYSWQDSIGFPNYTTRSNQTITLRCSECQAFERSWAVRFESGESPGPLSVLLIGYFPAPFPPTPRRLQAILGSSWELYLKGRRCEAEGLGLGAVTYYRRVMEDRWQAILAVLLDVASATGESAAVINEITAAQKERRFKDSAELASRVSMHGMRAGDENLISLLHGALSLGIHDLSEDDCVEVANQTRVLMTRIAERAAELVADAAQVKESVNALRRLVDSRGSPASSELPQ